MKAFALAVCVLHASLAHATSLRIHHRIWDPATPPPPFSLRANLQFSLEQGPTLSEPDDRVELLLDSNQSDDTLYQVALERDGDLSETDWDLSSVKACHLAQAQSDVMNIHLSSPGQIPYAIDFFLRPIPHDGVCPKKAPARTAISFTNTTLNFQLAGLPPLPELRVPPPLSATGEPIQPEPERSFIQKYWMYIAIGVLTLLLAGGGAPEDEEGSAQGRASGGRPAGR